jgi:hypothetical protein
VVGLVPLTSACHFFTANCSTISELRIIRDTPEARRLILEQGNRDSVVDAFWKQPHSEAEGLQRVKDMWAYPERYTIGRKEFLKALAQEPAVSLSTGTYLADLETSAAKCYDQPLSTPTFRKVRVLSGPHRGAEGWTCGPTKPVIEVP